MKRKAIKYKAKAYIKNGLSKQAIFNKLSKDTGFKQQKRIASILRYIPTLKQRKTYKVTHYSLLILISIVTINNGFTFINYSLSPASHWLKCILLFPDLELILIFGLATYRGQFYRYSVLLICILVFEQYAEYSTLLLDGTNLIINLVYTLVIGLAIYLHYFITPPYKVIHKAHKKSICFID